MHWVVTEEASPTLDQAVERTYAWNARKRQFSARQIEIAFQMLADKGWTQSVAT